MKTKVRKRKKLVLRKIHVRWMMAWAKRHEAHCLLALIATLALTPALFFTMLTFLGVVIAILGLPILLATSYLVGLLLSFGIFRFLETMETAGKSAFRALPD